MLKPCSAKLICVYSCILFLLPSFTLCSKPCNPVSEFKCQSGSCIPKYSVCDGVANCPDSSDEEFCLLGQRSASGDNQVISIIANFRSAFRTFVKDIMKEMTTILQLRNTLSDGTETVECNQEESFFCAADNICISLSARCDTKQDCSDGEDERPGLCSIIGGSSLRRSSNKKALFGHGNDEQFVPLPDIVALEKSRRVLPFIPRAAQNLPLPPQEKTETLKVVCNSKQFACDNTCIPLSWVCDDLEDCIDKTDESQDRCRSKGKTT